MRDYAKQRIPKANLGLSRILRVVSRIAYRLGKSGTAMQRERITRWPDVLVVGIDESIRVCGDEGLECISISMLVLDELTFGSFAWLGRAMPHLR